MEVPLVVFVNSKSGGLQGTKITSKFKKCVPPENVFDLSQGGPLPGLQKYTGQKYRIIVCGGDGSVGWVLTEIDKLKLSKDLIPPVAILPIGTGNDLSRVLKWGGTHPGTKLKSYVQKVEKACVVLLDKWQLTYTGEGAMPHAKHFMNNYFSVGADAHIALQFHEMRLAHPEKFSSRTQNLAWYVRLGLQNRSPEVISSHVQVEINGKKAELPEQTRCVVVLNLPSYSGGANPWGSKKSTRNQYSNPAIDDGLLEVVAMNGPLQLVGIHASIIRGKRLGQGNHIKITTTKAFSVQVDGEPWTQPASVTNIQFVGKSRMLANSMPSTAPQSTAPKLTSTPSSASLVPEKEQVVARSFSSHTLMRTRSASNPIQHTPSPLNYGPVQPSKRRKGRMYCESCGLEFYLPYMLANHHNSGLCTSGSSSVKAPSTPTLSVQVGDGASTHDPASSRDVSDDEGGMWRSQSEDFGSRKISMSDYDGGKQDKISVPTSPREIKSEPQSQPQSQSQSQSPQPQIESQPEPQKQAEPQKESQTETIHPESQSESKSEFQSESKSESKPESQSESPSEPQPLSESQPESDSQQEQHETTQENNKAGVEASVESVPLPEHTTPTTTISPPTIESNTGSPTPTSEPSNTPQESTSEDSTPLVQQQQEEGVSLLVDEGVSGQ